MFGRLLSPDRQKPGSIPEAVISDYETDDDDVVVPGKCGEQVTGTLYGSGLLVISGSGAMKDKLIVPPWDACKDQVKQVVIETGITTISARAFLDCTNLTSVTIPDTVTSIGYAAFRCCYSLSDVYYGGTEEQWVQISIASFNENLTYATIHFNCGTDPDYSDTSGDGEINTLDLIILRKYLNGADVTLGPNI